MGKLTSSENSLNQHIKNKHAELWEGVKHNIEQNMSDSFTLDKKEIEKLNSELTPNHNNDYLIDDETIKL